ncbi:unknown [Clostridium sp. CAG:306]|nr:unknown [Clostridium sp. CAG:306]
MNRGKKFRPDTLFHIFLIALAIFILGVQLGIKHGRELQKQDFEEQYCYSITD